MLFIRAAAAADGQFSERKTNTKGSLWGLFINILLDVCLYDDGAVQCGAPR